MVRKPCASTAGAARRGGSRLGRAATRTVSRIRTVSIEEAGSGERGAVPSRPSVRYAPTPAATTTTPLTAGTRDRGLWDFAADSGVVGAPVISVGASAVARARGRAAARDLAGEATGCSGQTAVAKSSMVGKRWSGSLARAREMATVSV